MQVLEPRKVEVEARLARLFVELVEDLDGAHATPAVREPDGLEAGRVRLDLRDEECADKRESARHRVVPRTFTLTEPELDLQYQRLAGPGRSIEATQPALVQSETPSVAASVFFEKT